MKLKLTLNTVEGRIGTEVFTSRTGSGMTWDRDGDDETESAVFDVLYDDDQPHDNHDIDGDEWRELEGAGLSVGDIWLMTQYGISVAEAVDSAIEGSWPLNFDGDICQENAEQQEQIERLRALLTRAAEYVERFADDNDEPADGDCRSLLAEINNAT
jgi:hypothetical protein